MRPNKGFRNERQLVYIFDQAKVGELPKPKRYILREIFGALDDEEIIKCDVVQGMQKPDIYIEYKGIRKYLSIKTGRLGSVHQEKIETLLPFFKEVGFTDEMLFYFKLFFYRDGTADGTGETKHTIMEMIEKYPKEVARFNEFINSDYQIIEKVIDRIMFKGSHEENIAADYLYLPDLPDEIILSRKMIMNYIHKKSWKFLHNPHIGPLQYRPHILETDNEWKKKYTHRVDFWWISLEADAKYIFDYLNDDF